MKLGRHLELTGYLGKGTEIHGTIRFRRLLRVDGLLTGRVESYDTLVVGEEGRIEAELIVGSLQVRGRVKGRVAVDKTIEIFPGGRVEGELFAPASGVKIAEGGVFEGQLHMNTGEGSDDSRQEPLSGDSAGTAGSPGGA